MALHVEPMLRDPTMRLFSIVKLDVVPEPEARPPPMRMCPSFVAERRIVKPSTVMVLDKLRLVAPSMMDSLARLVRVSLQSPALGSTPHWAPRRVMVLLTFTVS